MARSTVLASAGAILAWSSRAGAVDLGELEKEPVRLQITETSVMSQHFDARTSEGEQIADHGYGAWLNRFNLAFRWTKWTVGMRFDSAVYWRRPDGRGDLPPPLQPNIVFDGTSRYRDSLTPAKLWVTYAAPGLEVTAGDAYVQMGRGLVLSMRKIDELGIDTTLRGGKIAWQRDPFALTLVAGFANPTRVDEASGRALVLPRPTPGDPLSPQPLFGSDRIVAAEISAGRGLPLTLTSHAVRLTRCAPYRYDTQGRVIDGAFDAPLGSCAPSDNAAWLSTLPKGVSPLVNASEVDVVGQSFEVPDLFGHGKIFVEAAAQRRHHDDRPDDPNAKGNALYAAVSVDAGPVTNTLELKSYRNFYPLAGAVDVTRASAFSNVIYSSPPTAEVITQDSMFGFFNACVDGGRLRTDVRLTHSLLVYAAAIYASTKSEIPGGGCDWRGHTLSGSLAAEQVTATVRDGLSGFEWAFDRHRSHFFLSSGVRDNAKQSGELFYREAHVEYAFVKYLSGPYSIEATGRIRFRKEDNQNRRGGLLREDYWHEGENYLALKIAPKWVFSQGLEHTTLLGLPTYYVNGAVLYKVTSDSNVRVFVGQQRGGLRCVSGFCKFFPAFEGARVELTIRL